MTVQPLGQPTTALRTAIVGDATLTGHCIDVARDGGLDVVVVATDHPIVRERARAAGIAVVDSADVPCGALDPYEIDVLLSIANLRVLPGTLLRRVRHAVNFHDGPLPSFAGLNVTTWALAAGAERHAITWHLMTEEVDGGAIVDTEEFAVHDGDTAFSLNARCYEAAIASFPRVVAALVSGSLRAVPQPAGDRRTYRRFERPAVVVDPAADPATTARYVRALSLGHAVPNTVGVAHLVNGDRVVAVTGASVSPSVGARVGTVRVDGDAIRIAGQATDLVVDAIETVDGRPLAADDALAALGVSSGDVLDRPPAELTDAYLAADPELARREPAWRSLLAGAEAPLRPWFLDRPVAEPVTVRRSLPQGAAPDHVLAALVAWHRRTLGASDVLVAVTDAATRRRWCALAPLASEPVVRVAVEDSTSFGELAERVASARAGAVERGPFLRDLVGRDPALRGRDLTPVVALDGDAWSDDPLSSGSAAVRIRAEDGVLEIVAAVDPTALGWFADQLVVVLASGLAAPRAPIGGLPLLGEDEVAALDAINRTAMHFDRETTVDQLFRDQVARTPAAPAITADGETSTYADVAGRVAGMAARLERAGVARGDRVGIALGRGTDMVVALLATHTCGAAYVPLDPTYPPDRIALMIADSGLRVLIADPGDVPPGLPDGTVVVSPPTGPPDGHDVAVADHGAEDLAYVIYTSGSTGTPKGVMLEHRNVVNFFAAMDAVIDHDPPGVWLAVTSLSFDISVLELLWTLTRGFHVVVKPDTGTKAMRRRRGAARPVTMSLFYFAAGEDAAADRYRLLLDSARWADAQGFEAVWTPERHFHAFGGAYPNPSVIGAAVASVTERIRIRAGSVVAPLHAPARIAEEWAVVDNLSGGRVDISFAAGWQPNDFVLNPGAYATARESLPGIVDTVRRLWRGEAVDLPGHDGAPVSIRTLPRPVQAELPVWLTSAGSTATFERAGTMGVNLLTHLLGQSVEQLSENIAAYRRAWHAAGHAGAGRVTLMLHTYVDDDGERARRIAREPLKRYLGTAAGLLRNMASAFPTFAGSGQDADAAFASLTADELDQLLDMAADRYLHTSGLFGTVEDATAMLERCSAAGADEIACLIDFGIDTDLVLRSLPLLGQVHDRVRHRADEQADGPTAGSGSGRDALAVSFADLVATHAVTHVQCTPSLATMLVADPADRAALGAVRHLMLGGEALPTALATELTSLLPGRLTNMYGPTETTIWSLVHEVVDVPVGGVPIGRPIGNNTVHVLDGAGRPVPIGTFGELHIGGDGVARGYHGRPELTAERFVDRPGMGRVYATGDVVRIAPGGVVEFAGRADHQVKIRGHRIELGEIETVVDSHPDVVQSVVVAHRPSAGDPMLLAFVVARDGATVDEAAVRSAVAARLPEAYVPSRVVQLDALPLTPNGKTDRGRLTAVADQHVAAPSPTEQPQLADDVEQLVAEVWHGELHRSVGADDNFFDIGGNSLLAVSVVRALGPRAGVDLSLTDVFRYPTIRSFAAHVRRRRGEMPRTGAGDESTTPSVADAIDRGAMRRRALARRGG